MPALRVSIFLIIAVFAGCKSVSKTQSSTAENGIPYLGIQYVESADGIQVVDVFPESPAQKAGIVPGDVVLSVDGVRVYGVYTLREIIRSKHTGEMIGIEIRKRESGTVILSVPLERIPEQYFE